MKRRSSKIEKMRKTLSPCPRSWTPQEVAKWIEILEFNPHDVVNFKKQILERQLYGWQLLAYNRSPNVDWMIELGFDTQTHIAFMRKSLRELYYRQTIYDLSFDEEK